MLLKLDFKKVEQHTGDKWLIQGTTHHKGNSFENLELPCRNILVEETNLT